VRQILCRTPPARLRRAEPDATILLKQDSASVKFGVLGDGFVRRVTDGSIRVVSLVGSIVLRPHTDAAINLEGTVRIGSSSTACDDDLRDSMRFSRGTGFGGRDELLVCDVGDHPNEVRWNNVL
jgi:hypothetical protein